MIIEQLIHLKINSRKHSSNYLLCDYFLQHKYDTNTLTLKRVMQETTLSKSTIIRFFQLLNENNFTHFVYAFETEIAARRCRERVLMENHNQPSIWDHIVDYQMLMNFVSRVAEQISRYKKLIIIAELRDIILVEPSIAHLFDQDIVCDVIWDMPGADTYDLPQDAYYILIMSHYTPSNFMTSADEILAKYVKTILDNSSYQKSIIAYASSEYPSDTYLPIKRNTKPYDKKILLLSLFGALHNQILYGMNS